MKTCKMHLRYLGTCKFQDKLWFIDGELNSLFSIDIHDFTIEYKQTIPFSKSQVERMYTGNGCAYKDKIFFFPFYCRNILAYDIQSNVIQEIPISIQDGLDTYWVAGIVQKDEQVWIFPIKMTQGILILNLETMCIERDVELEDVLRDVDFIHNYGNIIRLNEMEIAILSGKHTIVGIDFKNRKITFRKRFDGISIWGIRHNGSDFWLLSYEETGVYKWNRTKDCLVQYRLLEEEWINGKGGPYVDLIFGDDRIILLPCCLKYIMCIDKGTNIIRKATEYPDGFCFFNGLMAMAAFSAFDIVEQHKVLLHPSRGNMLLIYDIEKNLIEGKELTVTPEQIPHLKEVIKQRVNQENGIVSETDVFGVELLDLAIDYHKRDKGNRKQEQVGSNIYNTFV